MISLLLYLGLGALTLGLICVWDHMNKAFAFDQPEENWWLKLLEKVVLPVLFAVFVIAGWPVALFLQLREILHHLKNPPAKQLVFREFSIARGDLGQQVTVEEIEEHESIFDPLGAVPAIPFGHLNAGWLSFKAKLTPHDSIWTFSRQWMNREWKYEERTGYVILRDDRIGSYFLTTIRGIWFS